MKPKRIVDNDLLDAVRNLICLGCASLDPAGAREAVFENEIRSHPHHVITKAAGGHDVPENLMPLCWKHHREIHIQGLLWFSNQYPVSKDWLDIGGWTIAGEEWHEPDTVRFHLGKL